MTGAPVNDIEDVSTVLGEAVFALFLVAVIAGILTFVLLRAASKRADAMVTISLSVLTLVSIVGFIATGSETLGTLAGAGIGALAGALTNLFGQGPSDEPPGDTLGGPSSKEG